MQRAVGLAGILVMGVLSGCLGGDDEIGTPDLVLAPSWLEDAVVIAVVDFGFNPYHLEWDAAFHPANRDGAAATDFGFNRGPHDYLGGFPQPQSFASYQSLPTTRSPNLTAESYDLRVADEAVWEGFQPSTPDNVSYYWVPDTKVIGLVSFSRSKDPAPVANSTSHGSRVASVTAGSIYGACPECLLVFIQHGPGALQWANSQPWIDVVTNSYGASGALARTSEGNLYPRMPVNDPPFNGPPFSSVWLRTHIYAGDDTNRTREAVERGQTTVFSSGNGARNSYNVPTTPLTSSQRGPDWILRVGAIYHDTENAPMGVGKPVDVASLSTNYPSQGHPRVSDQGTMSGTSNAAPVTAGMLARVLFEARVAMDGPSRSQQDGTVAVGAATCGPKDPDCAIGDGVLTRQELLDGFLGSAVPVVEEWQPSVTRVCPPGPVPIECVWPGVPAANSEMGFMVEGHGTYWGRYNGNESWQGEITRAFGSLAGTAEPVPRPAGEAEWFQVVSYCNQQFWGEWDQGAWRSGEPLPGPDASWPTRTALAQGCDEAAALFHAYIETADAG